MQVTPVSKTLAEIFKESFIQIPRFQRPYDWTSENISDFWNDLWENRDADYFMGSILVFRDTKDKKLLYVVDGQQRLTTLTIFLTTLRDAFLSDGDQNLAAALQGYIQTVDDDDKQRYVLTHQNPRKLLQHGMQSADPDPSYKPADDEERAIQNARRVLDRYLNDHLKGEATAAKRIDAVRSLRQKTLDIKFITIELDNEDDAYIIFEVLNTRGKDLRVSDLLKNLLTKYLKAKVKGADPAKDKWDKIASQLDGLKGSYDIDSFIFHYWLAHEFSVAKAKLFKSFKAEINGNYILDLATLLAHYSGTEGISHERQHHRPDLPQRRQGLGAHHRLALAGRRTDLPALRINPHPHHGRQDTGRLSPLQRLPRKVHHPHRNGDGAQPRSVA